MRHEWAILLPYIVLTGWSVIVIAVGLMGERIRSDQLGYLAAFGLLVGAATQIIAPHRILWNGLLLGDSYSTIFNTIFMIVGAVVCWASASWKGSAPYEPEFYGLIMLATVGLMLMAAAGSLLILFIGIELSTISLFALVSITKRDRKSAEAGLKLFVLGAVASAVFLYGASLIYGAAGTTEYWRLLLLSQSPKMVQTTLLFIGFCFVVGALSFKLAAAPFHLWAPDVYQGAPTIVSAFISTVSKAGAFAALIRIILLASAANWHGLLMVIIALAAISMVVGNLVALAQTSLKRLLAYSGVAQVGYILTAVAVGGSRDSISSAIVYLLLYSFTNAGAFLVCGAMQETTDSETIESLRGLHRRSAPLAFAMLILLLSLGGIPPLAGFVGKIFLFEAAYTGGLWRLVLLGAIMSVVALYYYLSVVLQMYIRDPDDDRRVVVAPSLGGAIALCTVITVLIGAFPAPWIKAGNHAASSARKTFEFEVMASHRIQSNRVADISYKLDRQ